MQVEVTELGSESGDLSCTGSFRMWCPSSDRPSDKRTWLGSQDPCPGTTTATSDLKQFAHSLVNSSIKHQYIPVWEIKGRQNTQVGRVRPMTRWSGSSYKEENRVVFFLGEGVKQISICSQLDPRSQCLWVIQWCHAQKQGALVTQIYADLLNLCAWPVVTRVWLEVWSFS